MDPERPRRFVVGVEGEGEVEAVPNLLHRLVRHLELPLVLTGVQRWPAIHAEEGLRVAVERARRAGDCDAFLVLQDDDDGCPRVDGPRIAAWLRTHRLPFPAANVLLCPEYEVLFLPCLPGMAGKGLGKRPGLRPEARWSGGWESKRGIKEWLGRHFAGGRRYKPTLDQLALTQMIDLPTLLASDVACVGTLERALRFLARAAAGDVYPTSG